MSETEETMGHLHSNSHSTFGLKSVPENLD